MNIRTFISDKQALIDEGKRIVSSNHHARFLRKVSIQPQNEQRDRPN